MPFFITVVLRMMEERRKRTHYISTTALWREKDQDPSAVLATES